MGLCEEYVLQSYTHALEAGYFGSAFSKINMDSAVNDNVKLCLSVMTDRMQKLHTAQTDYAVMVLEKHVGNWPNKAASDEMEEQKHCAKGAKDKKKSKLQALLELQKDPVRSDTLTPVPDFLRQFSEVGISTIKSHIYCCSNYYPTIQKNDKDTGRPEETGFC